MYQICCMWVRVNHLDIDNKQVDKDGLKLTIVIGKVDLEKMTFKVQLTPFMMPPDCYFFRPINIASTMTAMCFNRSRSLE